MIRYFDFDLRYALGDKCGKIIKLDPPSMNYAGKVVFQYDDGEEVELTAEKFKHDAWKIPNEHNNDR
jgi:hypothetical protein